MIEFFLINMCEELRAKSVELSLLQYIQIYISVFLKFVICLESLSSLVKISTFFSSDTSSRLQRIMMILAHSKTDLLAIFRKFAKSLSENDPEPSAILLEILIPAPLNCSANLNRCFSSSCLAISNNSSDISIAFFQISRFSNRNILLINFKLSFQSPCSNPVFCSVPFALSSLLPALRS